MSAVLRFVEGDHSLISWDITARENIAMPITPSHVEMLSRDGKSYIGAHLDGGIKARPIGYDAATMKAEFLLELGSFNDDPYYEFLESKIGTAYDWTAIVDFLLPVNWHQNGRLFCSAFALLALRRKMFFPWPVAIPAHLCSPRDLLVMISARVEIKEISQ